MPRKKHRHKPRAPKEVKVSVSTSTSGGLSQPAVPQPVPVVTVSSPPAVLPQVADTPNDPLLSQEVYDKHRALLADLNKANADQHDKGILQLTGVTLVLSVTFVDKIAQHPLPYTFWLLFFGWACLAISMAAMLFSFHTGTWACDAEMAWLDHVFATNSLRADKKLWSHVTTWLNRVSCILLMVGVLFILIFSGVNLPSAGQTQQQEISSDSSKGGEVPKSAQPPLPPAPDPRPDTGHVPPARPVQPPPIKK